MKLYTIFGNPVGHSKSPLIHNAVFSKYSKDARYIRTLVNSGEELKKVWKELEISGASVTVPHKETAFQLADEVRGVAKDIGAVNCLVREGDKIVAYNTDGDGFLYSIVDWCIKKVLVIGAGGTAKAVIHSFLKEGFKVSIVNRSEKRLEDFKELPIDIFTWENFEVSSFDLILNVTSAGLNDDFLPMPKEILEKLFQKGRYVADAIYKETPFLKLAKKHELETRDGSMMLVYQGVLANYLFLKGKVSKDEIRERMLEVF
jgi:shikimate dehydrogenase